jgi:hypothetical protein
MPPLERVRRASPFDPHVLGRSPLFWPIREAGAWLASLDDFPPVSALASVFRGAGPVAFAEAHKPRRRQTGRPDPRRLYDGRITLESVVPSRPRSWHDLMNALVWGAFPRAKLALHARQHRAIVAHLPAGARRLPPARSRELDALALVDEGGIVMLASDPAAVTEALSGRRKGCLAGLRASGSVVAVVFGHAVYESLALGVPPAVGAALVAARDPNESSPLHEADAALEKILSDPGRLLSPRELLRADVAELV